MPEPTTAAVVVEIGANAVEKYLSIPALCVKLSRKKSWVYAKLKNDPTFPKPIPIGSWNSFRDSEIEAWVRQQSQPQLNTQKKSPGKKPPTKKPKRQK